MNNFRVPWIFLGKKVMPQWITLCDEIDDLAGIHHITIPQWNKTVNFDWKSQVSETAEKSLTFKITGSIQDTGFKFSYLNLYTGKVFDHCAQVFFHGAILI